MEKVIQIISSIDTQTQKTVYVCLTDKGNLFKSFDLEVWDYASVPIFNDKERKIFKSKLHG